jgi:hypothetical protein
VAGSERSYAVRCSLERLIAFYTDVGDCSGPAAGVAHGDRLGLGVFEGRCAGRGTSTTMRCSTWTECAFGPYWGSGASGGAVTTTKCWMRGAQDAADTNAGLGDDAKDARAADRACGKGAEGGVGLGQGERGDRHLQGILAAMSGNSWPSTRVFAVTLVTVLLKNRGRRSAGLGYR